jgi:hypothetical protein
MEDQCSARLGIAVLRRHELLKPQHAAAKTPREAKSASIRISVAAGSPSHVSGR